jgi:hypothetical protein
MDLWLCWCWISVIIECKNMSRCVFGMVEIGWKFVIQKYGIKQKVKFSYKNVGKKCKIWSNFDIFSLLQA